MKLTLQIQLMPDTSQADVLRATIERFNEAATWLAGVAFAQHCANKIALQKLAYYELRDRFGLPADTAIRCIAQVVEAYKRDKTVCPTFRPHAAVPFSMGKNIGFKGPDRVSISTLDGRVVIPYLMGAYQQERFGFAHGQADLVLRRDGKWFLLVTVDLPDGTPLPISDFIGVDLGVVNLATTSDGATHTGEAVDACRTRYARRRQRLQKAAHRSHLHGKRPKNIRRALQRTSRREAAFRRDVNHVISKTLVASATDTLRGIALEDLTGIRAEGTPFRQAQRARMTGWAFAQLRTFIEYKARLSGVPVALVDPRHTSQMCSCCHHVARANRRAQAVFSCRRCGYSVNADFNAALNLRFRALVNAPLVAGRSPRQLRLLAGDASDKRSPDRFRAVGGRR
ncbi:MAG TPA: transposase [Candidatus Tectomicrobia bacterium]